MFSVEFFFKDCCEQADFYNTISDSKNHDDKFSHKHELEVDNEEAEGSSIIINSDYYKPEDLVSLDTKKND